MIPTLRLLRLEPWSACVSCRLVHTTPPAALKRKPPVIVNIETHPFHKVVKFVRPDELKQWDPRRTNDLQRLDKADPNELKLEYRPFAHIIDALPEDQRKWYTIGFGNRKDMTRVIFENMLSKTRRHKYDEESLEFKITWATFRIRNFQDLTLSHPFILRSGYQRNLIHVMVGKRTKYLNQLRYADYKRFEWILEVLGVIYKLKPPDTKIERKTAVNVLVAMYCNELRDKKMAAYKDELETQKVPFLKEKLETLMAIRADEDSVGLGSSVDDDIRETRAKLQKLDRITIHPAEMTEAAHELPPPS